MRFIFLVLFLYLVACNKDEPLVYYKEIDSGTKDILYAIDTDSDDNITVVGGYVWSRGICLQTTNDLSQIQLDSFSNKGQFDLLRTKKDELLTVGADANLFSKSSKQSDWKFHRLQNWDILHNIIETENGYLASGGKSYEHGYIFLINDQYRIDTALYFGHEISQVVRISKGKYISVGWGNLMLSYDSGKTWKLLPNKGDFYASCVFTSPLSGWIVGYNGSLLESKDGGETWHQSSGVISGNGFNSFRKIVQPEENELIITGNNGKLWRSLDFGRHWVKIHIPDDRDIYDIVKKSDGKYVITGSEGYLAELSFRE
jgi:photosystem II stability/assembly factor-like uncharacterized protein